MKDAPKLINKNQVPGMPQQISYMYLITCFLWASHLAVTLRGWDMWLGTAAMESMMFQPCKLLTWV